MCESSEDDVTDAGVQHRTVNHNARKDLGYFILSYTLHQVCYISADCAFGLVPHSATLQHLGMYCKYALNPSIMCHMCHWIVNGDPTVLKRRHYKSIILVQYSTCHLNLKFFCRLCSARTPFTVMFCGRGGGGGSLGQSAFTDGETRRDERGSRRLVGLISTQK